MDGITSLFRESVEFANPEYLAIVPVAGLLLVFGLLVFAVRLLLRPVRTAGSSYPLFGHIKFWFLAIAALALVAVAAAGRASNGATWTWWSPSTRRRRCGSRTWARHG